MQAFSCEGGRKESYKVNLQLFRLKKRWHVCILFHYVGKGGEINTNIFSNRFSVSVFICLLLLALIVLAPVTVFAEGSDDEGSGGAAETVDAGNSGSEAIADNPGNNDVGGFFDSPPESEAAASNNDTPSPSTESSSDDHTAGNANDSDANNLPGPADLPGASNAGVEGNLYSSEITSEQVLASATVSNLAAGHSEPIYVGTIDGLNAVRQGLGGSYIQTADIDLSEYDWTPIGTMNNPFTGIYDGGGYEISGLKITGGNFIGLFGYIKDATLANIALVGVDVTGSFYVDGLVGCADSSIIENCYATGTVTGLVIAAGGLVGQAPNSSTISSSYSTVAVKGDESVGGLVGDISGGTIENCYATGDVYATLSDPYSGAGGLVGDALNCTIKNCYAASDVTGSGDHVGGLVGRLSGSIVENCYTDSDVTGMSEIGGLVGDAANGSIIKNSYAAGTVAGTGDHVGGLVGNAGNYSYCSSEITNSFWNEGNNDGLYGVGNDASRAGVTGTDTGTLQTLAFHVDTLKWNIEGSDGSYPVLGWHVDEETTWYMVGKPESEEEENDEVNGNDQAPRVVVSAKLEKPAAAAPTPAALSRAVQTLTILVTPNFVSSGTAADLKSAKEAYAKALQLFEAQKENLTPVERATGETTLAVTFAATKALEAALQARVGEAADLDSLLAAYREARAVLEANRSLLTPETTAYLASILAEIAALINTLS